MPAAGGHDLKTCLAAADAVVTQSHAYRNASVKRKQQMRNAYNAEVSRLKAQCVATYGG
jgi:hypothetical protein